MSFRKKCREQDSNLHTFRYQNLNLARLPIPPSRLADETLLSHWLWASPQCKTVKIGRRKVPHSLVPREFEHVETRAKLSGVGEHLKLAER